MKLKQILFLTFVLGQSLVQAGPAAPVAPDAYVPFENLADMQSAMNVYATAVLNNGPLSSPYFARKEALPDWKTVNPEAWQAAEMKFLNQDFAIGGNLVKGENGESSIEGEVSSSDLVKYLQQNGASSGNIDTELSKLQGQIDSFDTSTLPKDFSNSLQYIVESNLPNFDPFPTIPNTDEPSGPGVATGTGTQAGASTSAAEQAYNQALTKYQAQVKNAQGLQQLQDQLGGLNAQVVAIQKDIADAMKDNGADIDELNAELTNALADQVAARDAIRGAGETPIDEVS